MFSLADSFRQTCPSCGASVDDARLHNRFHESLAELGKGLFLANGGTGEEWERAVTAAAGQTLTACTCGHLRSDHLKGRYRCGGDGCGCQAASPRLPREDEAEAEAS